TNPKRASVNRNMHRIPLLNHRRSANFEDRFIRLKRLNLPRTLIHGHSLRLARKRVHLTRTPPNMEGVHHQRLGGTLPTTKSGTRTHRILPTTVGPLPPNLARNPALVRSVSSAASTTSSEPDK